MRKSWTCFVCGAALVVANAVLVSNAQARPDYNKEFWGMYGDMLKAHAEAKCGACHGSDKKVRNDYGKAVGAALGGQNVKDGDKIKEALKKAEGEKSGTDGKTFGELIKDGKLPGK